MPNATDDPFDYTAKTAGRVAAGALVSTLISVGIAAILGAVHVQIASHLAFLLVAGAIGIILGLTGYNIGRIDAGFLFAFFLFEPIGPVLLHQQTAPAGLAPALVIGLAVACWFMHKGSLTSEAELPSVERPVTAVTDDGSRAGDMVVPGTPVEEAEAGVAQSGRAVAFRTPRA